MLESLQVLQLQSLPVLDGCHRARLADDCNHNSSAELCDGQPFVALEVDVAHHVQGSGSRCGISCFGKIISWSLLRVLDGKPKMRSAGRHFVTFTASIIPASTRAVATSFSRSIASSFALIQCVGLPYVFLMMCMHMLPQL